MTRAHEAWTEAADRIAALALKLKLHAESELGDAGVSVTDLGRQIGDAISAAAETLADACRDEAIRQDLRDAGTALADAVHASVQDARAAVRPGD